MVVPLITPVNHPIPKVISQELLDLTHKKYIIKDAKGDGHKLTVIQIWEKMHRSKCKHHQIL